MHAVTNVRRRKIGAGPFRAPKPFVAAKRTQVNKITVSEFLTGGTSRFPYMVKLS
jgi:hypothetical protein